MVVLVTATQYNESVGWKFEITKTGEQFYRVVSEFWQIKPVLSHLWGAKITRVIAIHYVCVNNRMQAKWLIRNHCSGENLTKKKLLWMRQSSIRAFIHKSQVSISIIQTLHGSPLSSSGQSSHMLMRNQKFCHRIRPEQITVIKHLWFDRSRNIPRPFLCRCDLCIYCLHMRERKTNTVWVMHCQFQKHDMLWEKNLFMQTIYPTINSHGSTPFEKHTWIRKMRMTVKCGNVYNITLCVSFVFFFMLGHELF